MTEPKIDPPGIRVDVLDLRGDEHQDGVVVAGQVVRFVLTGITIPAGLTIGGFRFDPATGAFSWSQNVGPNAALSAPSEPVRPEPRVPGTAELSEDVQYGYRYRAEGREAWTRTWKCKDRDEAESLVAHVCGEGAVEAEVMTRVVQSWRPEVVEP